MSEKREDQPEGAAPAEDPIEEVTISEEAQQMAEDVAPGDPSADPAVEAAGEADAEDPPAEAPPAPAEPSPEQQIAELKDRLLRALADVENTRRRAERDVEETRKYAASNFAKDLLNVSDNLRRALDAVGDELRHGDENVKNLVLGIEMVEKELLGAFERHGILKIEPTGEPFDHNFHQAMYEVPGSDQPAGSVVEVLQPGYVMRDRLLRPAMVTVAKAGGEDPPEDPGSVDTTA